MAIRKRKTTGTVDGGEGRGIPMNGRDDGLKPTGHEPREIGDELEEEEEEIVDDDVDLDEFLDDGDSNPGDRRRDPLRRPH